MRAAKFFGSILAVPYASFSKCEHLAQNDRRTAFTGFRTVGYYVDWAIYARKYYPSDLPASLFTHVHYAFAAPNSTGEVVLLDINADTTAKLPSRIANVDGNLHGCMEQLYQLKKGNRNLKTLLSIGGYNNSTYFPVAAASNSSRIAFAKSCVQLLSDLGFDGIDVDWEYPSNSTEASGFLQLLQAIRQELDTYASTLTGNPKFLLAAALPAKPDVYSLFNVPAITKLVDYGVLMAYDYAGNWSTITAYTANLYPDTENPASTPFNTEKLVQDYINVGALVENLVLGMPLYGHSFNGTVGMGKPCNGTGNSEWDGGVWDYKALPRPNSVVTNVSSLGGAFEYNEEDKTLVSYDTQTVSRQKAIWIKQNGLGGAALWESSGDRACNSQDSLTRTVAMELGGESMENLEQRQNWLDYPDSKYPNLRKQMERQVLKGTCPQ